MTDSPPIVEPSQTNIVDVWSRTAPKYRIRAVVMLTTMALLFGGLCCFTFWLRTGELWPWQSDAYGDILYRSITPMGTQQITLTQFLTAPINVQDVPIHTVIVGTLFASLASIPILVAILYRLPASIAFAAMVALLAAMPWLGVTVLIGCVVTALPRLRFSFRYASALLGLVPVGVYFVMASWEPAGSANRTVQNQALLYAPWVLALLSSCVICAVALAFARLINYRPGGVSPVLALLFAIPVYLFHTQVGRDELEYRILEARIGPRSQGIFRIQDIGAEAAREATRQWSQGESYDRTYRRVFDRKISAALLTAERDRLRAAAPCDAFIERFSYSRYVPAVLFLKGQALDQRILRGSLERYYRVEFSADMPRPASRTAWRTLITQFPDASPSAVALYRLAIFDIRDGRLDEADRKLSEVLAYFDPARSTSRPAGPDNHLRAVFRKADPFSSLGINRRVTVTKARRLQEMLAACRDDAPRPYTELFGPRPEGPDTSLHPLQVLLRVDESDPHYAENLRQIAAHFPDAVTADYVAVRLARLEPAISRRIALFRQETERLAASPAGAEAFFNLAVVLQDDYLMEEARQTFTRLTETHPDSCWAQEAKDRLASLTMMERAPN